MTRVSPSPGPVDHVGYLAGDVDEAARQLAAPTGLAITRRFERPEFSLHGLYLGDGPGNIEVFSYTDSGLLRSRLAGHAIRLDHVALLVADIASVAAAMRSDGVRFSGPDLRGEVHEPIELSGALHLWTLPGTTGGHSLQLVQR